MTYLYVNITFNSYAHISPHQILDLLVVNILDQHLFVSTESEILVTTVISKKVPR